VKVFVFFNFFFNQLNEEIKPQKDERKSKQNTQKKKRITHTRSSETEVSQLEPAKKGYER